MWTKLPAGACSCQRGGLPRSVPRRRASWGHRQQERAASEWGILLAGLGAATAASHAQILLLPKGVKLEDGQEQQSPCHKGPVLSFPGAPSAPGGCPCLGLVLALAVRVLSCCACLLWSGETNGMASEEGEDAPAFSGHLPLSLHLQMCDLSGSSGQLERQPSRVFLAPSRPASPAFHR